MDYLRFTKIGLSLIASLSLASCTIETSDNGHLDGFWHLERVDTLATGGVADFSGKYVFWGVQKDLVFIRDTADGSAGSFYLRFDQTADSLHITKAYVNHGHEDSGDYEQGGDIPVETFDDGLRHFGINSLPEHFGKLSLSGGSMVLQTKNLRLRFRKF